MNHLEVVSPFTSQTRSPRLRRRICSLGLCLGLLLVLLSGRKLEAQTVYGSISGVVKDPSGAVISGADVVARESASTTEYRTSTNKTGSYRISFLKPGEYILRIEKSGFAGFQTSALSLVLNQDLVVDGALQLGGASETVQVDAVGSSLNSTNSQIGGQLSTTELIDLPENTSSKGANEFLMTKTFAGASSTSQDYSNVNNLSLGGGRPVSSPIIIDGLPSNMGTDGTYGLIPTPDSTEELQVLTAPFNAQYGQSGGGAILTTTKSGSDRFHGSAFETYNNQNLVALKYFTSPGTARAKQSFNYFGGSLGGPVLIPKLFDGRKHRLYFFTDWEDTINNAVSTVTTNVPTAAELTGDFSGITPQGTASETIYDPATSVVASDGTISRTAFAGNIIPAARLDAVGVNIAKFFPAPNCSYNGYNYCLTPQAHTSYLYNADRIDYSPSDYDHVWAKFSRDGPRNQPSKIIPNAANTSSFDGWTDDHYAVSWNHIFSPRISNEARIGYVSEENFNIPPTADASAIGLQGVPLTQFPSISTGQLTDFGADSVSKTRDGHYIFNDAVVMQIGRHSISVGGEFMRYAFSDYTPGVLSGSYDFDGSFTSGDGQSGLGLPDLLLGYPASSGISTTNTVFHENLNYFAGYIQDDYRLSSRLTLNLGLRYEFDGPYSEVHNQMYTFNPAIVDSTTQHIGGIQFAGHDGAPHSLIANVYTGILPRVGFNYRLLKNTVLRGGYGIYQLPSIGYGEVGTTSASTVSTSFQSDNPATTPAFKLSQGVPAYSANVGADGEPLIPSSLTNPSSDVVQQQLTAVLPYLQEWQFGVQQDLGHEWILDVDYEGNHGVHLPANLPSNQIAPTAGCCNGVENAQSLRPYPQFLSITHLSNAAASKYAALFATLSHRWSNGISMRAAYTWAHTDDDVDGPSRADAAPIQNVYNLHAQWGTAMTDIPQRLSVSAVYALPIGSGGRFLHQTPVLSQAIGHWKISTIAQFQQGYPYFISQKNQLGLFSGGQYVTETGNPSLSRGSRTVQKWFNTAAFATTPADTLGNAPRAAFHGPGQNVWDLSLMRDIPVHDKMKFTLRVDAHNAFNHPQFSGLNTTITNAKFGQVTSAQDARQILLIARFNF